MSFCRRRKKRYKSVDQEHRKGKLGIEERMQWCQDGWFLSFQCPKIVSKDGDTYSIQSNLYFVKEPFKDAAMEHLRDVINPIVLLICS